MNAHKIQRETLLEDDSPMIFIDVHLLRIAYRKNCRFKKMCMTVSLRLSFLKGLFRFIAGH